MRREDCQVGMSVSFGRPNGEKTRGIIIKINKTRAKIQTTEPRGDGRPAGQEWSVPFGLIYGTTNDTVESVPAAVKVPPLKYSPFNNLENLVLEAIEIIHGALSPENLACDGELPPNLAYQRRAKLLGQLGHLESVIGRKVSLSEILDWADSKREYERERDERQALAAMLSGR